MRTKPKIQRIRYSVEPDNPAYTDAGWNVIIPDVTGKLHDFDITYRADITHPGWHVVGDDLDAFVPYGSVAFPTATNVVVAAYRVAEADDALTDPNSPFHATPNREEPNR